MLAYFFAFRYIMEIYISRKKAICLGSITKCHVIRTDGGFQVGYKDLKTTKSNLSCKLSFLWAFGGAWGFRSIS